MYVLTCDSTVDIPPEELAEKGIPFIPFPFSLDGKDHLDDRGQTMPYPDFYNAMRRGASTGTSQINPFAFERFFEPMLKDGKDVLHCMLSSGITGVRASAESAKAVLESRYPGQRILLLDSLAATGGEGMLLRALAKKRDEGLDLDALYDWGVQNRLRVHHWFFTSDLTWFIRGGRVSKAAGAVGGALGICPLLHVDAAGGLTLREKHRPKKRVIRAIVDKMALYADGGTDYAGPVFISHADCEADARAVADLIAERFPKLPAPPELGFIGTTVGAHTGPGTVALFFWGTPRDRK